MVTMFCEIDDFCRSWLAREHPPLPARSGQQKGRGRGLSWSEVMTMVVFFPVSPYRTFKHFSQGRMLTQGRAEFPSLPSYHRFVELIPLTLVPLCSFMQTRKGQPTGIQFIDSWPLRVCHNRRLSSHQVFAGLAQRGQGSRGWFYGCKLPLVINEQGEVLGLTLTPGQVDDRRPVAKLVRPLWGQWFGDRGSLSQELFEQWWADGLPLITKRKRNRKGKLMPMIDRLLLRKRALMECVNDQRKNVSPIEHTRHRSAPNGIVNILAAVVAYTFQPKKPALDLSTATESPAQQLLLAAVAI
jgi:Transposase DDE domain